VTLRTRVTLAAGSAVLLAVAVVSITVYVVVRGNLRDQIDESLSQPTHDRPASTPAEQHSTTDGTSAVPRDLPLVHQVFITSTARARTRCSSPTTRRRPGG
jgi:hypothetical protein